MSVVPTDMHVSFGRLATIAGDVTQEDQGDISGCQSRLGLSMSAPEGAGVATARSPEECDHGPR